MHYAFDWPTFSHLLNGSGKCIKGSTFAPSFPQPLCTTSSIIMLPKLLLTSLIIGVLSASALNVPVARDTQGSTPGEGGEPSKFFILSYHELNFLSFDRRRLRSSWLAAYVGR